jgi:hypothetical protein
MTEAFSKLGLSGDSFDYYGYKLGPRFAIRGTVGKPDLTEVKKLLAAASAKLLTEGKGKESEPAAFGPESLLKMFQK